MRWQMPKESREWLSIVFTSLSERLIFIRRMAKPKKSKKHSHQEILWWSSLGDWLNTSSTLRLSSPTEAVVATCTSERIHKNFKLYYETKKPEDDRVRSDKQSKCPVSFIPKLSPSSFRTVSFRSRRCCGSLQYEKLFRGTSDATDHSISLPSAEPSKMQAISSPARCFSQVTVQQWGPLLSPQQPHKLIRRRRPIREEEAKWSPTH